MTKLSEAQRRLLERVAAEPEGVIDAPADGKTNRALIKRGLALSLPVAGGASRLIIPEAGRAAVADKPPQTAQDDAGGPEQSQAGAALAPAEPAAEVPTAAADQAGEAEAAARVGLPGAAAPNKKSSKGAPGGKLGTLVALLKRPEGATVEAMTAATGWQAHSVRGTMSGSLKKGMGFAIISEKTGGERIYKISAEERV